jgi:hypothetical protein
MQLYVRWVKFSVIQSHRRMDGTQHNWTALSHPMKTSVDLKRQDEMQNRGTAPVLLLCSLQPDYR